jgi:hypothetical protein
MPLTILLHYPDNKRLIKCPLDTAFSEKELIIVIRLIGSMRIIFFK